jgi:hypothetical protein
VNGIKILLRERAAATLNFRTDAADERKPVRYDLSRNYSYFSLLAVEQVFSSRTRGFDVDELPTHGGSLRFTSVTGGRFKAKTASG